MRKVLFSLAALLLISIPASAQDTYPSVEIFGGYSYFSQDLNINFDDDDDIFDFDEREAFHGVGFSLAGNFNRHFGLVGDFSYNKREIELPGDDLDVSNFVFLFGPRFSARGRSLTGFGHVLIGGTRSKIEGGDSATGLTIGIGGGLDVNVSDGFAIRLGQIDYLPTRYSFGAGDDEWFNNFRFQIGVVFKAGNR